VATNLCESVSKKSLWSRSPLWLIQDIKYPFYPQNPTNKTKKLIVSPFLPSIEYQVSSIKPTCFGQLCVQHAGYYLIARLAQAMGSQSLRDEKTNAKLSLSAKTPLCLRVFVATNLRKSASEKFVFICVNSCLIFYPFWCQNFY